MTGLDPEIDAVVEVCAERWVGDQLVIDEWRDQSSPEFASAAIALAALPLMQHLIEERGISAAEISELRRLLDRLEEDRNESGGK